MWPLYLGLLGVVGLGGAWWVHQRQRAATGSSSRRHGRSSGSRSRRGKEADAPLDTVMHWEPVATRVLTNAERDAYHVLRRALPDHVILAQVPIARFLKVPTRNSYNEWLRRVGGLCADLVVCDMASQVVAVVEVRLPAVKEKDRAIRRQQRMDKVLAAARIPVHVWMEGALPGPAVAREAILGAALSTSGRAGYQDNTVARRDAEAAAVVAAIQAGQRVTGALAAAAAPLSSGPAVMPGVAVQESSSIDFNIDAWSQDSAEDEEDAARKEPPPSTWFDDLDGAELEPQVSKA